MRYSSDNAVLQVIRIIDTIFLGGRHENAGADRYEHAAKVDAKDGVVEVRVHAAARLEQVRPQAAEIDCAIN